MLGPATTTDPFPGPTGSAVGRNPDYGVDGWAYVVGLLGGGVTGLAIGAALLALVTPSRARVLGLALSGVGIVALVPGLLGLLYVRVGKFRHRDRLLARVAWRGDERSLDVGTGGGLLLVGAAKRSPTGTAFGVDIWATEDLSNNTYARAVRNVELEGVRDRVEIRSEDARALSLPADSIDVVVSMLCIHNIPAREGQDQALREMVRVCKPGGSIIVSDLAHTERYAVVLRALGLTVTVSGPYLDTFPPQRILVASKRPA